MSQGHYSECKKPISKGHISCDSIYVTFPNDKITEMENTLVVARGQDGEAEKVEMTRKRQYEGDICGDVVILYFDYKSKHVKS